MKLLFVYSLICLALISCKRNCLTQGTVYPYKIEGPKEGAVNTPIKFSVKYQIGHGDQISDIDLIENNFEKTLLIHTVNENCAGYGAIQYGELEHTFFFKKSGTYYLRFPRGFGGSLYSEEDDLVDTLVIY